MPGSIESERCKVTQKPDCKAHSAIWFRVIAVYGCHIPRWLHESAPRSDAMVARYTHSDGRGIPQIGLASTKHRIQPHQQRRQGQGQQGQGSATTTSGSKERVGQVAICCEASTAALCQVTFWGSVSKEMSWDDD